MVDSKPLAPAWERIAHHTHLYVLPAAGAASLALGGLATMGATGEPPQILPVALMVAGASSLVGSLASYMCIPRAQQVDRSETRTPVPAPPHETSTAPQKPGAVGPARSRSDLRPHRGIGRATLAELAHVEDELWKRWASPRSMPLGAPLVGPVPETAYSPARAGGYPPFADRDRDVVVLSGSIRSPAGASRYRSVSSPSPVRSATSNGPRSPGSPDAGRADISISPSRATLTRRPSAVANPGGYAGMVSPLLSGRSGELFDMDALDHPAYLASINPILPRLSESGSKERKRDREEISSKIRPMARGGVCSECSRRLLDFRAWVECRVCRKPLCRKCLQDSFSTDDAGSCSDCRVSRKWSVSRHRNDRREEASGVRRIPT